MKDLSVNRFFPKVCTRAKEEQNTSDVFSVTFAGSKSGCSPPIVLQTKHRMFGVWRIKTKQNETTTDHCMGVQRGSNL